MGTQDLRGAFKATGAGEEGLLLSSLDQRTFSLVSRPRAPMQDNWAVATGPETQPGIPRGMSEMG